MDQPLYDIYFTGQLVEGADEATAKSNLAALFKAAPDKVGKFFDGKSHLLKRGIDKQAALKYKAALHQAGLLTAFKAHQSTTAEKPSAPVAKAPSAETNASVSTSSDTEPSTDTGSDGSLTLAPTGSDVLKESERSVFEAADIDISNIKLVSAFIDSEPEVSSAPPAPDTSHLSVAAAGEDILVEKPVPPTPVDVDIDDMTLAPPGEDLDQIVETADDINPDLSQYSIAETGADLLEGQPKKTDPPAPNTDHISIAED